MALGTAGKVADAPAANDSGRYGGGALLAAGSDDFRTPPAPETLQVCCPTAIQRRTAARATRTVGVPHARKHSRGPRAACPRREGGLFRPGPRGEEQHQPSAEPARCRDHDRHDDKQFDVVPSRRPPRPPSAAICSTAAAARQNTMPMTIAASASPAARLRRRMPRRGEHTDGRLDPVTVFSRLANSVWHILWQSSRDRPWGPREASAKFGEAARRQNRTKRAASATNPRLPHETQPR
jgi:hypothetical protein